MFSFKFLLCVLLTPASFINPHISTITILCSSSFLRVQHSAPYRNTDRTKTSYNLIFLWIDTCLLFHILFSPPLPSARQHPSYGDCLEVKREYYQNCSVRDCVTQCSQSAAHLYEQFLQVQQIGFVTLRPLCLSLIHISEPTRPY